MEENLSLEEMQARVVRYFRACARRYGLQKDSLAVRYILNWGGFVNASFTIEDGQRAYHLKLANLEDTIPSLERWMDLREPLEKHYRAPKIVDWVEIEGTPLQGLLFEHFAGSKADFLADPGLHRQVLELITRLHADRRMAEALVEMDGPPGSCADYFISTYIDRFDEDLLVVVRDLPDFVSLQTLDWMQGETRHMESIVRERSCFALPADSPTHGDLWENNVLVNAAGDWVVLDWDDLALGDPALEYGILLSKIWRQAVEPRGDKRALDVSSLLPAEAQANRALHERLDVCLQAYVLDGVIDTLADYVECEFAPDHQEQVKAEKKKAHLAALDLYKRMY